MGNLLIAYRNHRMAAYWRPSRSSTDRSWPDRAAGGGNRCPPTRDDPNLPMVTVGFRAASLISKRGPPNKFYRTTAIWISLIFQLLSKYPSVGP
jgi:hypothetical protein